MLFVLVFRDSRGWGMRGQRGAERGGRQERQRTEKGTKAYQHVPRRRRNQNSADSVPGRCTSGYGSTRSPMGWPTLIFTWKGNCVRKERRQTTQCSWCITSNVAKYPDPSAKATEVRLILRRSSADTRISASVGNQPGTSSS